MRHLSAISSEEPIRTNVHIHIHLYTIFWLPYNHQGHRDFPNYINIPLFNDQVTYPDEIF